MVRPRYRPNLVFRLSLVFSKFKISEGIQLYGLKITSYGKSYPQNSFLRSDLSAIVGKGREGNKPRLLEE